MDSAQQVLFGPELSTLTDGADVRLAGSAPSIEDESKQEKPTEGEPR
jgi:hypothetical protein